MTLQKLLKMIMVLIMVMLASISFAATEAPETPGVGLLPFLASNWAELLFALMAFAKVVVRLTPTLKDDKVFGWLDDLIAFFIPNIRKT